MAPRHLRLSLVVLQLATIATLVRSVALDRWITVAASLLLLGATFAARRGRTWGVAAAFTVGVTFLGLWSQGVGTPWFALVGILAVRPFLRLFRHFLRFDRGAATLLAAVATALGIGGAVAWKAYAFALFEAFPALMPSLYPHHGMAIAAMLGGIGVASHLLHRRPAAATGAVAPEEALPEARVRIAADEPEPTEQRVALEELEAELESERDYAPRARKLPSA